MQSQTSTAEPSGQTGESAPAFDATAAAPSMQLDIACWADGRLLVSGWILGLVGDIAAAELSIGELTLDVLHDSICLPRPDVSRHFGLDDSAGDQHGFYALVDLRADALRPELTLRALATSGVEALMTAPIQAGSDGFTDLAMHAATLQRLLLQLPAEDAVQLTEFAGLALPLAALPAAASPVAPVPGPGHGLDPPTQFVVDLCCLLDDDVLVVSGWMLDPLAQLGDIQVRSGVQSFALRDSMIATIRPDLAAIFEPFRKIRTATEAGFLFAARVASPERNSGPAVSPAAVAILVEHGSRQVRLENFVVHRGAEARRKFTLSFEDSAPDTTLLACGMIERLLAPKPRDADLHALLDGQRQLAIARLPTSLQGLNPRYLLNVDQAVAIADRGVFLLGWFAASPAATAATRILCHCGEASFDLTGHWVRYARSDVAAHLSQIGVGPLGPDQGYICFVPLDVTGKPCYLSVEMPGAAVRRMSVTVAPPTDFVMQPISFMLSAFNSRHPELARILSQHVGPGIGAAWATRARTKPAPVVTRFGEPVARPTLSVIVPLFGRHDFAEYQLALFADDPDFAAIDLIYVVDDPFIYEDFRSLCAGLHGMYRIPFTVVFPGANLGFAGANNCGAEVARAGHLLLMNSDVMPRGAGWASALLGAYARLPDAGILGTKLVFENGSVQHAGMQFRRSTAWADMWINFHPMKGQSASGLSGTHEVEAVTAACMLLETEVYRSLGGLCEDYIMGDFEDSDLCLRVRELGRRIYVALDVELYHLERQSQNRVGNDSFRTNLTLYNCWLHQNRWAAKIEALKR